MRIYPINNIPSSNNCVFGARILPENAMELYKDIKQKGLGNEAFQTVLQKFENKGLKNTLIAIGAAKVYQDNVASSENFGDFVDYSAHTGRQYTLSNSLFGDEKAEGIVHKMSSATLQEESVMETSHASDVDIETVVDGIDIDANELKIFKNYMQKQAPGMAVVKLNDMLGQLFAVGIDDKKLQKMLYIAQGVDLNARHNMDIQSQKAYEEIQSFIGK